MSDGDVREIKYALSDPTRVLEALGIEVGVWRELLSLRDNVQASRSLRMFARHVDLDGPSYIETPCWIWTGATDKDGYGKFGTQRASGRASRLVLLATHGFTTLHACHHCDNPACVRPIHIWAGTVADNNADCVSKGRVAAGDKITKNRRHASGARNGRHTKPERTCRGEQHPCAKLDADMVRRIRAEYATGGVGTRSLAIKYGVARNAIRSVLSGRSWAHV